MSKTRNTTRAPYALLVRTDGTFQILDWPSTEDTGLRLKALYVTIDCDRVDAVDAPGLTMWVDDEGLIKDNPAQNILATALLAKHRKVHQMYFGHAVFTGGTDRHGNSLGLTEDAVLRLVQLLLEWAPIPAQRTH
ncbi:DUF3846 domain-containing protein [Streptomyces sp. NPDC048623]|uniref:DUF3846 domain-containing protein n=1 Tax=Streptomyces sp. NPDC048623 TaxID=3155761 RepID=UPI003432DD28